MGLLDLTDGSILVYNIDTKSSIWSLSTKEKQITGYGTEFCNSME